MQSPQLNRAISQGSAALDSVQAAYKMARALSIGSS
jgi:hypothetical protein